MLQQLLPGNSFEFLPYALVFAAVVLAVIGAGALSSRGNPLRRRLQGAPAQATLGAAAPRHSVRFDNRSGGLVETVLAPLRDKVGPKSERERSTIRRRLIQAGFMAPSAPATYYAMRLILALALPIVFTLLSPLVSRSLGLEKILLIIGGLSLLGYYAPTAIVSRRVAGRQRAARDGFPDALDLLLVCVEAGLGLDAAIGRVGEEIGRAHPLLGEQFTLMGAELRAGKSREEALRNFADRIGIEEVSSLTSLLIQSDKLGTSIGDALRAHSDDMRMRRMMKAEEKAQQLSVKLTVPLVVFILPALVLVILSPATIGLFKALKN